jgi:hypothetical protein
MDCFKKDNENMKELIYSAQRDDVRDMLKWKYIWKKIGNVFVVISHVFTFIGIGFSFSTSFFEIVYLSYISGCLNLLGVLFMKGANNAYNESEKRTAEINIIMRAFGLKEMPNELKDISHDVKTNTELKSTNIDDIKISDNEKECKNIITGNIIEHTDKSTDKNNEINQNIELSLKDQIIIDINK